jgi:hypothetical protein
MFVLKIYSRGHVIHTWSFTEAHLGRLARCLHTITSTLPGPGAIWVTDMYGISHIIGRWS